MEDLMICSDDLACRNIHFWASWDWQVNDLCGMSQCESQASWPLHIRMALPKGACRSLQDTFLVLHRIHPAHGDANAMQAKGIPCSLNQEQMVLLSTHEDGAAYNQAFCFNLDPSVDAQLLNQALMALIDRHEPLRTSFTLGKDGIHQHIASDAAACGFQLAVEQAGEQDAAKIALHAGDATLAKTDLQRPSLMSAKLCKVWSFTTLVQGMGRNL